MVTSLHCSYSKGMNKKLLLTTLILLLVIGGGLVYVLARKDTGNEAGKSSVENTEAPALQADTPGQVKGSYVDYTEEAFTATQGTKVLFFHAPWCPQCRALDESIRASELPKGVTIFKVDYDSNQQLRAKYGVTLQTTVVKTDEEGNKIGSYVAYDEPTFQSVRRTLLP